MNSKKSLREKLIAARQLIKPDEAQAAASSLAKYLLDIIPENTNVAGYCAIRGEIDVSGLLAKLQARGDKTALPVVIENEKILKFIDCTDGEPLIVGKFGVFCPKPHLPEIEPDVVIVPMVGFDGAGHRLGYGGGYYDATLASLRSRNKKLLVIGVAYAMQRVENLATEPHDEKMDMIVTDDGLQTADDKKFNLAIRNPSSVIQSNKGNK